MSVGHSISEVVTVSRLVRNNIKKITLGFCLGLFYKFNLVIEKAVPAPHNTDRNPRPYIFGVMSRFSKSFEQIKGALVLKLVHAYPL